MRFILRQLFLILVLYCTTLSADECDSIDLCGPACRQFLKKYKAEGLPVEIRKFSCLRIDCAHLVSEGLGDHPDRDSELISGIEKFCKGNETNMDKLRKQYSNSARVLEVLSELPAFRWPDYLAKEDR